MNRNRMGARLLCELLGHRFGIWEYAADDSCEQTRVCKRDGYEQKRQAPHQFSDWIDDGRVCRRCGYEEERRAAYGGEQEGTASGDGDYWTTCPECGGPLCYVETVQIHNQEGWIDECENCRERYRRGC